MLASCVLYSEMVFMPGFAILAILLRLSAGQNYDVGDVYNVQPGQTYYINHTYASGTAQALRWVGICPAGFHCRLDCPQINLPNFPDCSVDRLLITRTEDHQSNDDAELRCGPGSTSLVSVGQQIGLGLRTSSRTPGGNFSCQMTAEAESLAATPCRCGYKFASSRIVGGEETGLNEFPMMALLGYGDPVNTRWGGTIIDKKYVLSCAHTLSHGDLNLFVVVGAHHIMTTQDSPATKAISVDGVFIHPYYDDTFFYDYDIAILRVNEDIVFSERVGPACLPFSFTDIDFTGSTFTLLGWGRLRQNGLRSSVLRKVDVSVIPQSDCQSTHPFLTPRQICTHAPAKDACQGDSGGPALYAEPASSLLFLCGIISYGNGCAEDGGVYTRVTSFLDWITQNTPDANYCRT